MIRFECDYAEGCHPKIIERLQETNFEQTPGYGEDVYCQNAKAMIKKLCKNDDLDIYFLVGGTQANLVVIASVLKPYQGVISAVTGHINTHETGAVEATGHRVIAAESSDGKITAEQIKNIYDSHYSDNVKEHTVQPGMVYISHPTENGTTYTKSELEKISSVCRSLNLPLYMDGARLGYGIVSEGNDLFMEDISKLCDVFYIGGTKVGAMFGEAVVISGERLKCGFKYMIKQRGALLSKGRLLGIQFETLFKDNLYFDISKHAVDLAMRIKNAFSSKGYRFMYDSKTNQQFPIMPRDAMLKLMEKYSFYEWAPSPDGGSAARFCTSWATDPKHVDMLIDDINKL